MFFFVRVISIFYNVLISIKKYNLAVNLSAHPLDYGFGFFRIFSFLNLFLSIFLQQYTTVPQTPLLTSQVLKEETEQWPEVQQEMSMALKVQYS